MEAVWILIWVLILSLLFGWVGSAISVHKSGSKAAGFWLGFFLWPIGLIIAALLGPKAEGEKKNAQERSSEPTEPEDRKLENAKYKIWLIECYGIEKNDVLNEFVCGELSFKTIDEALIFAHHEEDRRLEDARYAQEQEQALRAEQERQREIQAGIEAENAARRWERIKPKIIVLSILSGGLIVAFAVFYGFSFWREEQSRIADAELVAELNRNLADNGIEILDGARNIYRREVGLHNDLALRCEGQSGTLFEFDAPGSAAEAIGHYDQNAAQLTRVGFDTESIYRSMVLKSGLRASIRASKSSPSRVSICIFEM